MTYQPGEQPYTQPQDPWAGTQGIAAAPTDPIPAAEGHQAGPPQRGRGQFAPGVASPSVWSQETVSHSDPYAHGGGGGGGRAGLYLLVVLLVVVLGGAGGFGAWWAITNYASGRIGPSTGPSTEAPSTGGSSPTAEPTETPVTVGTLDLLAVGDCLINRGTAEDPEMYRVACDWPGDLEVVQIIRIATGPELRENEQGRFDLETAREACSGLPRFNLYYALNHENDDFDFVLCLSQGDIRAS